MQNLDAFVYGGNFAFTKGGLVVGTTTTKIKTANSITYCIDGQFQTAKAGTDNIVVTLPTGGAAAFPTQPVSSSALAVVGLDASGNVVVAVGKSILTADLTAKNRVLEWPSLPAAYTPIGWIRVATDSTHTFVWGTGDFSGAGITTTFGDLFNIPANPVLT